MPESRTDVLVAAYPDVDAARQDFDALAALVRSKGIKVEGIILVTHDEDGNVTVADTATMWAERAPAGAAASACSSACSRRRCSRRSPLGAAAGAIVGTFAKRKLESGIGDKIGEALPAGSAGIIAVVR